MQVRVSETERWFITMCGECWRFEARRGRRETSFLMTCKLSSLVMRRYDKISSSINSINWHAQYNGNWNRCSTIVSANWGYFHFIFICIQSPWKEKIIRKSELIFWRQSWQIHRYFHSKLINIWIVDSIGKMFARFFPAFKGLPVAILSNIILISHQMNGQWQNLEQFQEHKAFGFKTRNSFWYFHY